MSAVELCRKYGQRRDLLHVRSKYGGMDVLEAKRLKALEGENARLRHLPAEAMLDVSTLQKMFGKTSGAQLKGARRELGL